MKYIHIVAKVLFTLVMLSPILGVTGVLGQPTRELYNTDQAFAFIQALTDTGYMNYLMAIVHAIALFMLWTKREALAALLELPLTVNIIAFHLFLDGGLFTAGAVLGNLVFLLNLYFLWRNRAQYRTLLNPNAA